MKSCSVIQVLFFLSAGEIPASSEERESEGAVWSCHVSGASSSREDQSETWPHEQETP